MPILGRKGGYFGQLSKGSETLDRTFEGFGEMYEGDFADMCTKTFPHMLMGGRAEGLAFPDPVARTPIGVSGNSFINSYTSNIHIFVIQKNREWFVGGLFAITKEI